MGRMNDRIGRLEDAAAGLPARGCATCAEWKDFPVTGGLDMEPHGWPEDFRCPSCGREPLSVVKIVYTDWPPQPTTGGYPWRA